MKTLSRKSFEKYCDLLDKCENDAVAGFGEAINKAVNGFANASSEEHRSVYRDFIVTGMIREIVIVLQVLIQGMMMETTQNIRHWNKFLEKLSL